MIYPLGVFAVAVGLFFAMHNLVGGFRSAARIERDPERALAIVRGFRRGIVGLAVAGIGVSFAWDVPVLLGLSLVIVAEELLESTVMIQALKDGSRDRSDGSQMFHGTHGTTATYVVPGASSSHSSSQRRAVRSAQLERSQRPS